MFNIRRAEAADARLLSEIAYNSEAYWGYDSDYMEKFRSFYQVTGDFINNSETHVLENQNRAVGFYGLIGDDTRISLEYFFIEPQSIGKGYGKLLWKHLVDFTCKNLGIDEFLIITSPQAKEFYTRLGAVTLGEVESLLKKGCMIPQLLYKVVAHAAPAPAD
ncbi:acetyltransferase [Desulfosporosinus orientis DSM 765]|uniref:Acetyltransferase n=1 Tax=Desulfosporosinus orientis (strain ATCC 19365 / DSM 765 / NCIMB 8382 / VKM B-1628 / Singapore I) TaxID=768706 RepID=G7W8Q4_DESOD|nr:GNAT family N-acetyltransferase [Desulfosporosinus orientis]AET67764.1 acetyltransferase [Desulfosporosinus orientis DSM 765]